MWWCCYHGRQLWTANEPSAAAFCVKMNGDRRRRGQRVIGYHIIWRFRRFSFVCRIDFVPVSRRLHWMTAPRAPAHRENVPRVIPRPIVKRTAPPIERHVNLIVFYRIHSCTANELRILFVDSLKFLTHFEEILLRRWWLTQENLLRREHGIFQLFYKKCLPSVDILRITQWRLQLAATSFAMANRVNLMIIVNQTPEIVLIITAVEPNAQPRSKHIYHRSDARRSHTSRI